MTSSLSWSVSSRVRDVSALEWDALVDPDDPFLEHAFLLALEDSYSTGRDAGCEPRFILVRNEAGALVGGLPLYLKVHSYGEFIFDWAWAAGAQRAGVAYYPKLVAAIPYTPVTSSRLLVRPGENREAIVECLLTAARDVAKREKASSVHMLFCREAETDTLAAHGYVPRLSFQFHWHNRTPEPYRDYEDFLSGMRAESRKQLRKERRIAASHGLTLVTRTGAELGDREWDALHHFYLANADKHDATTYLQPAFFPLMRERLAHRVVATLALRGDVPVAGTINFERGRHLYGRYWGCLEERDMLHFELCYHQLIDRAIARGHTLFEAGAQGEHKLKRGLLPNATHSAHWLRHPGLAQAVERFVHAETADVKLHIAEYTAHGPQKRGP